MSTLYSSKDTKYLCMALGIALTIHAVGIWWLQTLRLDNTFASEWRSEIGFDHPILEQLDSEELLFKRNDQLAEAFQRLKEIPVQEVTEGHDEIEMLSIEFTDLKFQDAPDGPLLTDSDWNNGRDIAGSHDFLTDEADSESRALLTQAHDPHQELSPTEFKPSVSDFLQPNHQQVTQELIRITELIPIQPLFTPFEKIAIGESARNMRIEAPLLSGVISPRGFENEFETRLDSATSLPEGIRANAQVTRQTGNLFLPQANKKMRAQETTCALSGPNRNLVMRQACTETAINNDQFQIKVESIARKNGEGYLFRLQIQPLAKAGLPYLHRNLYFLIDRSSSVSPQRYEVSKAAVADSLRYLKEGDSFNILILDNQITMLAQNSMPWNPQQVENALRFLNSQPYKANTDPSDLYTTLSTIVPQEAEVDEINIAILLSDGETQLNREHQKRFIGKWIQRNSGKLVLFSVALPYGNNLGLLEVLSTFNHGKMYMSPNAASMSKTVVGLVQALQPVGKDLTLSVVPGPFKQGIVLSPPNSRVIPLFEKAPLVLYGSSKRAEDFYLFIQGRANGQRLDLKQKVLLSTASKGEAPALEKAWALHNAQVYYERFMKDGNTQHLQLASQLLAPYHLPLAFY